MTRAKERVRGERDYIRKRGNIWYARFQYPDPLRQAAMDLYGVDEWPAEKQWSLNTSDELTARKRVADAEKEHIYLLDFHRAHTSDKNEGTFRTVYEVEPGTNEVKPDGTHIIATNKEIIALHGGGRMETRPNPRRFEIVYQSSHSPIQRRAISVHEAAERAAYEDMDEKTLKDYIAAKEREGKLSKDDKESAKRTLREFKDHNGNKPIVECTIEDVEKFIDWILEEREPTLSRGRVLKLIAFLKAAVNLDIERRKHLSRYKSNPFAHAVVPNGDEEEAERPSYTDEDVVKIKAHLDRFHDEEKIMLVWHISSSVRPGGIYSIRKDEWEIVGNEKGQQRRTRFVHILKDKGKYGRRAVPIPQAVLDLGLLPEVIAGPIFRTKKSQLLREINRKLYDLGINTDDKIDENGKKIELGKTLYSGRHRAKDKLDHIEGTTEELNRTIMGHARRLQDSHHDFGGGFKMYRLKEVMDRIGF